MKDRHPVVVEWTAKHAADVEAWRKGKGDHRSGFTVLEYQQQRLLSRIFYAVEVHGVAAVSSGYPHFGFAYEGILLEADLRTGNKRTPGDGKATRTQYFLIGGGKDDKHFRQWSDEENPLDDQVPDIVGGIVVAARSNAREGRQIARTRFQAELEKILAVLKLLEDGPEDLLAADLDPTTFATLVALAERHRSAVLVRRFLRSLAKSCSDQSELVLGRSLADWFDWAHKKADQFDPVANSASEVFQKIARS
jgi:hypothetical protein